MSDPADAARRQRAEQAARHERAKAWMTERVARKGSSFSCLDIIDAHRAGAREEAAIKDAEIAALRKSANEWALMAGKNHLEVKALREAVREIAPNVCDDCGGDGDLGLNRNGKRIACDSCRGSEDRLGEGYIENSDVDYREWMSRPEVRRALEEKP